MREVFADTAYWVALAAPRDRWRAQAVAASAALGDAVLVTTQAVLLEFLNFAAEGGEYARRETAAFVRDLHHDPGTVVVPWDAAQFQAGLTLYVARPDKGYSLTDCVSMTVMRARGISEVLTPDHHFTQEGFYRLMPGTG